MSVALSSPEERRRAIAQALLRLVKQGGIEAVSVRTVAAESGFSLGMVQRLFPSKDELIRFAFEHVLHDLDVRIHAALSDIPEPRPFRTVLEIVLGEVMMTPPEAHEQVIIWMTFLAQAAVIPKLKNALQAHYRPGLDGVVALIQAAQQSGEVDSGADPQTWALSLIALVDGLTIQCLLGNSTPQQARHTLSIQLDHLFSRTAAKVTPCQ